MAALSGSMARLRIVLPTRLRCERPLWSCSMHPSPKSSQCAADRTSVAAVNSAWLRAAAPDLHCAPCTEPFTVLRRQDKRRGRALRADNCATNSRTAAGVCVERASCGALVEVSSHRFSSGCCAKALPTCTSFLSSCHHPPCPLPRLLRGEKRLPLGAERVHRGARPIANNAAER